jgi:hypothetical protein
MNFQTKIQELQSKYAAINLERVILEKKMEHREEYKKVFFTVKSEEIKDELANLEIQKIRS